MGAATQGVSIHVFTPLTRHVPVTSKRIEHRAVGVLASHNLQSAWLLRRQLSIVEAALRGIANLKCIYSFRITGVPEAETK